MTEAVNNGGGKYVNVRGSVNEGEIFVKSYV